MKRKQDLIELRDKVKAGWVGGPDFMPACVSMGFKREFVYTWKAAQESLDAAKALHEAVLPSWKVAAIRQTDKSDWWVELRRGHITSYDLVVIAPTSFDADNPARAWLLAILEALIAQEDNQ